MIKRRAIVVGVVKKEIKIINDYNNLVDENQKLREENENLKNNSENKRRRKIKFYRRIYSTKEKNNNKL